jgi:Carboxypeptidase regulatory-like domain
VFSPSPILLFLGALPFALCAKGGSSLPSFSLGGGDFSPHLTAAKNQPVDAGLQPSARRAGLGAASFAPFAKDAGFSLSSTSQEPGQPPPPQPPPAASSSSKHPKQKYSHANDFLIRGTVFTDKALAFPGVQLRIRRASEKKFRWQDATNSRGEFAIRVPQGAEYEVVVHAKGFADQSKTIEAKKGLTEERLVFTLEPQAAKKGAKK